MLVKSWLPGSSALQWCHQWCHTSLQRTLPCHRFFQLGFNFSVTPGGGFRHTSSHVSVYLCGWISPGQVKISSSQWADVFNVSCGAYQPISLPLRPQQYIEVLGTARLGLSVLILGGFILLIDGLTHYTQGAWECIIENGLWFLFIYLFEFLISLSPPSLTLLFVALFQCWACCCFKSVEKRETYLCSKWAKRWSSRSPTLSPSS